MIKYVWYAPIYDFIFISQGFYHIDVGPVVHKEFIHSGLEFVNSYVVKSDFGLTQYDCILLGEL